jgi:hypothetical protein
LLEAGALIDRSSSISARRAARVVASVSFICELLRSLPTGE